MVAGDTCHISGGVYNETLSPSQAGGSVSLYHFVMGPMGETTYMSRDDIHAQMSMRDYWVKPKAGQRKITQRFGKDEKGTCWGIYGDRLPMGLLKVSAQEWHDPMHPNGEDLGVRREDWDDPRKGDLFRLLRAVEPSVEGDEPHRNEA